MEQKLRVYIAGSGGMLGEAFHRLMQTRWDLRCTDIDLNESWLSYLDFRDIDAYRKDVMGFGPDALFHIGAHTDLEYCELHPTDAYSTNTLGAENAVLIANALQIPVLYIGTAGIFDGKKDTYDDWDTPNPLGHYARSKYAGERYVVENAERYLVCRAGWMMGGGPKKDKKFVNKIMRQIRNGARELFVVTDKSGTPTFTDDFVRNTATLLGAQCWGVYNMVCAGVTSRFEVAQEMLRCLNIEESVKLTAVTSEHFSKEYFAMRPDSERLINAKLRLRGLDQMRDWRIALREYLAAFAEMSVGDAG